jgi:hypothetical protein
MMLRVFAALTLLALTEGCSSSEEQPAEPSDSGPASSTDTAPAPPSKTTGKSCTKDGDCDLGGGSNACSNSAFGEDAIEPSPVCIGRSCAPGDGSTIVRCDGDTGLCIPTDSGGVCLPPCTFDDSAVTGCTGKNACVPRAVATDSITGKPSGIGYCYGGCTTDGDCPTGNVCQTETLLCVKTKAIFGKTIGSPCGGSDDIPDGATDTCDCLQAVEPTSGKLQGYCVQTCIVGAKDACPAGFTCDAGLAKGALAAQAPGLVGTCQKDCTTDADCAGLNARCVEHAGVGKSTCTVSAK